MKNIIVKDRDNYSIVSGQALRVLPRLPPKLYGVSYDEIKGYSLHEIDETIKLPDKIYGDVQFISDRILSSFKKLGTNLGAMFSGSRGMGKTVTVKYICKKALESGLPIIMINRNIGNFVSIMRDIHQPCVVVLDEFEKIYRYTNSNDRNSHENQDSLLEMFDPMLDSQKLFLISCNDYHNNISQYLLNRPGRIHYHIKMTRLSILNIKEYCIDNGVRDEEFIKKICNVAVRMPDFSYDILRAIVFEARNYGSSLEEILSLLNIITNCNQLLYFTVYFKSGEIAGRGPALLNLNKKNEYIVYQDKLMKKYGLFVDMSEARWDGEDNSCLILDGKYVIADDHKQGPDAHDIDRIVFIPYDSGYDSTLESEE